MQHMHLPNNMHFGEIIVTETIVWCADEEKDMSLLNHGASFSGWI